MIITICDRCMTHEHAEQPETKCSRINGKDICLKCFDELNKKTRTDVQP